MGKWQVNRKIYALVRLQIAKNINLQRITYRVIHQLSDLGSSAACLILLRPTEFWQKWLSNWVR